MPLYMDVHRNLEGLTPEALRAAHLKDVDVQQRFQVHYHKYFFNEETGTVFCLAEGPNAEACQAVHQQSHGLVADEIIEVRPELVEAFFASTRYDDVGAAVTDEGRPDGALRVIMCTEIANFTAVAREREDYAVELLECHDGVVRAALAREGGREVRHTGEGIMACFTSVSAALRAATSIQRNCHEHVASGGGTKPSVRIGMSAGEPVTHHQDLFGAAVNTARRICEAAEPGQILVSGALRELGLGKGSRFRRVGERALKGVEEPLTLYAVAWHRHGASTPGEARGLAAIVDAGGRFWRELRRRRVVKVAVAYAVVLFGILQVAELTLEPLGLPDWSYELVLVLGLLGLPLAIALAWAFDMTAQGLERTVPTTAEDLPD